MPIYMEYPKITGSVTEDKHKTWIELKSFQLGSGRSISNNVGAGENRAESVASVSEITCSKSLDASSPNLFKEALVTTDGVKVTIDFVRQGKSNTTETYLQVILTNTLISGFSMSSGGEAPSESLSLSFTKFEYKYAGMKQAGDPASPVNIIYDLATGKTT